MPSVVVQEAVFIGFIAWLTLCFGAVCVHLHFSSVVFLNLCALKTRTTLIKCENICSCLLITSCVIHWPGDLVNQHLQVFEAVFFWATDCERANLNQKDRAFGYDYCEGSDYRKTVCMSVSLYANN